jgi:hypothetical protein
MKEPDIQDFYPRKVANRTMAQKIKYIYADVKKGM